MTRGRSRLGGLVLLGVALLWAGAALAQEPIGTFEQLTVGSTAVGITSTITNPSGRTQMNVCYVQADQSVRWRADGTNPTATVGSSATSLTEPIVLPNNAVARRFRVISTSGSDSAIVNVTCYP